MKTNQDSGNDLKVTNQQVDITKFTDIQEDCAFDGAMFSLVPITDAAHLIHGPSGCVNNSWFSRNSSSSGSSMYKIRFTSDMEESDIIFGGAKKLYKAILELERRYKPAAIFVYSTCVSALIGDDLNGACRDAAEHTKIPVIPVDSPGFVGGKNIGIRTAGETLLEHVIGTAEPDKITPYDINLIGDYNIAGAIWDILPLLEKLGIPVLSKITGDACYNEICYAHRAKLNVVISSKPLLKMAKKMEERFHIPYIAESFDSVEQTNQCLRNIAAHFGDEILKERTERLITEENITFNRNIGHYRTRMTGKRAIIQCGDIKSWSIITTARNLGMEVIVFATSKVSDEEKNKLTNLLGRDIITIQKDNTNEILQFIKNNKPNILIAEGRYQHTAIQAKITFFDINQELHHPHTGYAGNLKIAKFLYAAISSPVWQQVRKPIPF